MPRNNSKFSWSILIGLYLCMSIVSSANVAYPDSYEMYSYKQPRSMNDLKNQHVRQAMFDVTDTINEVQKILQKDPKLPRLTRGEIEDLFEMVTREEYKRSLAIGDYERAKHMRSLMLVLPFNTNNYSEERLEELFTQMPVTKMVNSVSKPPKPQRIVRPPEASAADMMGAHSGLMNEQLPTTFKPNYPTNMKPMYTAPVTTFHPKGNGQTVPTMLYPQGTAQMVSGYPQRPPAQMMTPYYPRSTMQAVSTFHPKPGTSPVSAAYNPKVTSGQMANYYPRGTAQMISTFHPKSTQQTVAANAIPTNYISTYHPKTSAYKITPESNGFSSRPPLMTTTQNKFSSRFNSDNTNFVTPSPATPTIRANVKHLLATIGLEPDNNAVEINNAMSDMQVSASSRVVGTTAVPTKPTTSTTTQASPATKKPVLTPELKEILQSFGLLTNEEQASGSFQDEFHPVFPSALKDESLSVSDFKPLPKSVTTSDINEKIDSSSLEIKPDDFSSFKRLPIKENEPAKDDELENLLKTYGLLEDDRTNKSEKKEIPDNEESESIEVTETIKKVPEMSEIPEVNVEFLSPELRSVFGNIGVRNVKKPEIPSTTPTITRRADTATTGKVSSTAGVLPSSTMENDYQKLHLLLDTIKQLDSLTANLTDEELDKLNLKNFNLSQDILTESIGPDLTYGFESEVNAAKNEVKRQTNTSEPTRIQLDITGTSTTSTSSSSLDDVDMDDDLKSDEPKSGDLKSDDSTTTETPERKGKQENSDKDDSTKDDDEGDDTEKESVSSSTTSTTEEPRNGSMSDLAGSFGGNDGLDPVSEEPLPPPRKNGFYFFSVEFFPRSRRRSR